MVALELVAVWIRKTVRTEEQWSGQLSLDVNITHWTFQPSRHCIEQQGWRIDGQWCFGTKPGLLLYSLRVLRPLGWLNVLSDSDGGLAGVQVNSEKDSVVLAEDDDCSTHCWLALVLRMADGWMSFEDLGGIWRSWMVVG
jgi:hypothetical protein